jgi:demethylmenaquinone methyltransferase / 2-methoxy-6-polyprenyl-1,4-benzoquinol methylase
MFSGIARRYDLLNRLITFGLDQRWRRALARIAVDAAEVHSLPDRETRGPIELIDCACGTGDVAFALAREMLDREMRGAVVGVDFSTEMIGLARVKVDDVKMLPADRVIVRFEHADAMALPYPGASFDACTIAFGLRNLPDMRAGVRELCRVVRPGGAVCILETGQPPPGLWRILCRAYSAAFMPLIGLLVSGNWRAYRYLYRTSWRFPSGTGLAALIEAEPRVKHVDWQPLAGGVAYLYKVILD